MRMETERLILRPWRVAEAGIQRELWTERDPRVPPHRRIDASGNPTLAAFEEAIRVPKPPSGGLLAIERKEVGDVVGYCGLIESDTPVPEGPELAFELLQRAWRQGYATEAATLVLERAKDAGCERVWATVWDWNAASRRVLAKLGFVETGPAVVDPVRGTSLVMTRRL